jgi:hypothetical protein
MAFGGGLLIRLLLDGFCICTKFGLLEGFQAGEKTTSCRAYGVDNRFGRRHGARSDIDAQMLDGTLPPSRGHLLRVSVYPRIGLLPAHPSLAKQQ